MNSIILLSSFKLLMMFLVAFGAGLLVRYKNVKVNYTRKINHFFLFFIPALVDYYFQNNGPDTAVSLINEAIFTVASFMVFIKPIRDRVPLLSIAFSSFDRPEDRPHTLLWYTSQCVVGYMVMYPAIILYDHYHMMALLNIQILIGIFGDGLAEPIGIRFGRHKYTTHSIFFKKEYVRSLEGSLAIFIVGIIVLFVFRHLFDRIQFYIALATIPLAMTLAEAISPHTWDDPLMIITGSLLIFLIKKFF